MTEMWLIRHGQTDWNVQERIQGSIDCPLNEQGIAQANALAQTLNGKPFTAIYSSHAKRALRTAMILAEHVHLPVQVDERLREISHGVWEGLTWQQVQEKYPQEYQLRKADPIHSAASGGESYNDVMLRMVESAREIAAKHADGKVLVVSHGMSLATLICRAENFPLDKAFYKIPKNADPYIIHITSQLSAG